MNTIELTHTLTSDNIQRTSELWNNTIPQLLTEKDMVTIKGKTYINRSGCRKIAMHLNINTEVIREERRMLDDDTFIYDFTVRASSPLGRYTEASASCNSGERDFTHLDNDVRATSQTRATNRAICDLIGFYEIPNSYVSQAAHQVVTETPTVQTSQEEEGLTNKQKYLLIKLIDERHDDEETRTELYKSLEGMTKTEARFLIRDFLQEQAES
ncbi:hypothetical protein LAT59_00040 [Candidatus Gracilibacteria bacterium]|nr:hypothetical protein [Candidatus Gracilibacteria bacterium]